MIVYFNIRILSTKVNGSLLWNSFCNNLKTIFNIKIFRLKLGGGGLKWQNRDSICGALISVCPFSWQRHSNIIFLYLPITPLLWAFEVRKFSKNQVIIPNNLKICIVKLYKTSIWWVFYEEQWNIFNLVPKPSHLIN